MSEEPKGLEEPVAAPTERQEYQKVRRPFSKLAIELEPEDLAQKGVHKMFLAEISRLESEVAELKAYEERFHQRDKECDVLRERSKKETMLEILYTVAIAIGAALLGWLPSSSSTYGAFAVVVMAVGLFAFALIAKWKGRSS